MNRSTHFNSIEARLSYLATRLEMRGGSNILDLNVHSENFYMHFLNMLFGWQLVNLNAVHPNSAGVDLVDTTKRIVVQVSATATKQKVESALSKDLSRYRGYSFKFISISKDARNLRSRKFSNPHELAFLPADDIWDVTILLAKINVMDIARLKDIDEFLEKELKLEPDPVMMESNLTTIIKIMSQLDWNHVAVYLETVPFEIDAKVSYNQLDTASILVDAHKIHGPRIAKIYSAFDLQGANKSLSVLNGIRTVYVTLGSAGSPDDRFFAIIRGTMDTIRQSSNYVPMPVEELELCVQMLVVDAFIRCTIFKNPMGDTDARS
jgi:hypothetical protein